MRWACCGEVGGGVLRVAGEVVYKRTNLLQLTPYTKKMWRMPLGMTHTARNADNRRASSTRREQPKLLVRDLLAVLDCARQWWKRGPWGLQSLP